jgi:hypothetical protein
MTAVIRWTDVFVLSSLLLPSQLHHLNLTSGTV